MSMSMSGGDKQKRGGTDGKFFTTNRKGEIHELREELRSPVRERKKDAVKKVIANMTVGKDVSTLFTDVVNCIQTDNLELKKLVYLYVMNYAKTQPDLALMCVNTFVRDANDPNPLIRALAIRTMGCIRVDKITEYLCEPLMKCLKDEDPYVRKTSAVCVAKLYDISPELVEDRGFIDMLRDLLSDANPTVVSNAVAALSEISETSGRDVMNMSKGLVHKLLAALNECTEWGQIFILDALASYTPLNADEAEGIVDRVTPRLQHSNPAVVMSAFKVILCFVDLITDSERIVKKLAPPLVTLLNSEPEIQYVALRNINLISLKKPKILENEIKVFFCKYNDPIYVKMEKLEIIVRLTVEKNADQVLLELKEYATEIDVEFVRRSVRAIGRCAIKLEKSAERCISVLLELLKMKVNYVVQEAIVVIKDIFRRYPNKYESIIAELCENLESLDEPNAKASMIWIIGEYAERIDNADELLDSFLESFIEESADVQLQLLTATVKLFLKQPENTQEMVQRVLNLATEDSDNPDLRDRGYIYWRLLSSDPEAARAIVLADKAEIRDDTHSIEPILLDQLMSTIGALSSIYHKPPEAFIMKSLLVTQLVTEEDIIDEEVYNNGDDIFEPNSPNTSNNSPNKSSSNVPKSNSIDLLDLMGDDNSSSSSSSSNVTSNSNQFAAFEDTFTNTNKKIVKKLPLLSSEAGNGLYINGIMIKKDGQIYLEMDIGSSMSTPTSSLAFQFNKNTFGITPSSPSITLSNPISNGSSCSCSLNLTVTPQMVNNGEASLNIQVAIKNLNTNAVCYFVLPLSMETLFVTGHSMEIGAFVTSWKSSDDSEGASVIVNDLSSMDMEVIKSKLSSNDINFVIKRDLIEQEGQTVLYFTCRTMTNSAFLVELKFRVGMNLCKVTVKCPNKSFADLCKTTVAKIIV